MRDTDEVLFAHLATAHQEFGARLRFVKVPQWANDTPCGEWTVRDVVRHMVQGNLIYTSLLHGGSAGEFMSSLDADTLGDDPVDAYERAAAECRAAFAETGALDRKVDYPFGNVTGRRLLGLMISDSVIHTWDLCRGAGLTDRLNGTLVDWLVDNFERLFHGVAEGPLDPDSSHQYFGRPHPDVPEMSAQQRLLHWVGRLAV
ncbi:MAG: TIGR03086 family metal-binding protein [Stackebrandtia sp.]